MKYRVLIILMAAAIQAMAQFSSKSTYTLYSKNLQKEKAFWVSLPVDYEPSNTYPVIYLLDAEKRFETVLLALAQQIEADLLKPCILVGVLNRGGQNERSLNFTFTASAFNRFGELYNPPVYDSTNAAGGTLFLSYLQDELVPFIETKYATAPHKMLIGHSYSGYFATHILTQNHSFTHYLILDPSFWYDQGALRKHLEVYQHSTKLKCK